MTSGNFTPILLSSITRGERQRKELKGIRELAWSINSVGLINPLVVTPDYQLVAGERRLAACRQLGWTDIPVQFTTNLSPDELHLIELEENIRRSDLPWKDEVLAVQAYHNLRSQEDSEWNQTKTAAALSTSTPLTSQKLMVAEQIMAGNEKVTTADHLSVAINLTKRARSRAEASEAVKVDKLIATATATASEPVEPEPPTIPLINEDFIEWAQTYSGPKFNLIHCDFPYGIDSGNQQQGTNVALYGNYEDTFNTYVKLLYTLDVATHRIVEDSAHLIFWFSMAHYQTTINRLSDQGWIVDPLPLVWHKSCSTGLLPDPNRGPRRTYETALFASRGDRKIVRAVANSVSAPTRTDKLHMSEKPPAVLAHFMRMVCDEYSTVLDPTCGSAGAIKVAEQLGASRVLGIEKDEEFFNIATENYHGN